MSADNQQQRPVVQARGKELLRQAQVLSDKFGLSTSDIVRMAVARLYMSVFDDEPQTKGE